MKRPFQHALTQGQLLARLDYDPLTGVFTHKGVGRGARPLGRVAGSRSTKGYVDIEIFGVTFRAHRLAWLAVHGEFPACEIDHINGDKTDNRIANLRAVTTAENCQNQHGARRNSTSGVRGVYRNQGKWQAAITVQRRRINLGRYERLEDAERAYLDAKKVYHPTSTRGAFA